MADVIFEYNPKFTDYTEVDPNSHITVETNKITFAELNKGEDAFVYRDEGIGYFDGDFEHQIEINITYDADDGRVVFCSLTNEVDDWDGLIANNKDGLGVLVNTQSSSWWSLKVVEIDGGSSYFGSQSGNLSYATTYYMTVKRDESVGAYGTLYCYIYSDADRTNLIETMSEGLHSSKKDYRYLFAIQSQNSSQAGLKVSGFVENIGLGLEATMPNFEELPLVRRPERYQAAQEMGGGAIKTQDLGLSVMWIEINTSLLSAAKYAELYAFFQDTVNYMERPFTYTDPLGTVYSSARLRKPSWHLPRITNNADGQYKGSFLMRTDPA